MADSGKEFLQKTMHFPDGALMQRFFDWCTERGVARGRAIQCLVAAFMDDLDLQKHQLEISLPSREVIFK